MLTINLKPSLEDRIHFFRALKSDPMASVFLKPSLEDNRIVAILDEHKLCGGVLLFGGDPPVYLFCFFYRLEYCTKFYEEQLKSAITVTWPDIINNCPTEYSLCKADLYDVYYIKPKSPTHSQTFNAER